MKKLYFLLLTILMTSVASGQVLDENFDYGTTAGDLTTASGGAWAQHSGSANPVQYLATPSLTMTGYPSSGIGGHASVSGTSQDVNRSFTGISSGTAYGSALINLSAVGTGNYFLHFNISGGFTTRIGARDDGSGGIQFGVETDSSTLTYGTTSYALNTTYLLVFSYEIATGVSNLHVLTAVTPTEPGTPEATNTGATGRTISAIAIRQSSNIPTFLIDGIRVATTWAEIMNNPTTPTLTIVTPADASVFDPGTTNVDVTFTTQNIDLMVAGNQVNVTVDANPTNADVSSPFGVTTVNGGMYNVTVELLENNAVVDTKMVSFSVASITQVTNITDLRAGTINEFYELTGEALISYIVTENTRNQKYIQDADAGILIDDVAGTLSAPLNIGDGITGLQGQLSEFGGIFQFIPSANVAGASSNGNTITPIDVTVSEFLTNGETYESRLIRLLDVNFADMGTFADNTNYNVTVDGGTDMTICRVSFGDEDLIGSTIPTVTANITGLGGEFSGARQILPRYDSDVLDATLSVNSFDTTNFSIFPNPTNTGFVNITTTTNAPVNVVVFDILGKEVISKTIHNNTLNVSNLNAGIYILKLNQNEATVSKKLVIK